MDTPSALPTELQCLLDALSTERPEVRAMFRYALVLMMIDDEKARVVETHQDGETLHLSIQTRDGGRFSVVRPEMSEEVEQLLLEQIREIVAANSEGGDKNVQQIQGRTSAR